MGCFSVGLFLLVSSPVFCGTENPAIALQNALSSDYSEEKSDESDFRSVFCFSNEWGYSYVSFGWFSVAIEQIKVLDHRASDQVEVAVLTGQSSIHALLAVLKKKVELVVMIDRNPLQLNYQKSFLDAFLHSSPCGGESAVTLNLAEKRFLREVVKRTGFDQKEYARQYFKDKKLLQSYHPFFSHGNYLESHRAACQLLFSYWLLDLSSQEEVSRFGDVLRLHNASVKILNVSNAYEWVALDLKQADLKHLYPAGWPFNDEMLFIYSRIYSLYPSVRTVLVKDKNGVLSAFQQSRFTLPVLYINLLIRQFQFLVYVVAHSINSTLLLH
jgi:hypothetical protein